MSMKLPVYFWIRAILLVLLAFAACWMVVEGVAVRKWTYVQTQPLRFTADISRGFRYGLRAHEEGYLDLYDRVLLESGNRNQELDYAPLRVLIMRTWAGLTVAEFPEARTWEPSYAFTRPALRINTAIELFGTLGLFLLVRLWVIRGRAGLEGDDDPPLTDSGWRAQWQNAARPLRGCGLGLVARACYWFNPAVIVSAHGWPTWDIWIVPFYVWAILMISLNQWYLAGALIGIGALLKGQQLIVAPVFLLLALFLGRPGAAASWLIGWLTAVAMVVGPWMLRVPQDFTGITLGEGEFAPVHDDATAVNIDALIWLIFAVLIGMVAQGVGILHKQWSPRVRTFIAAGIGATLTLVWLIMSGGWGWPYAIAAGLALAATNRWFPSRSLGYVMSAIVAGALLLCMPFFNASTGWLTVGWKYGSHHWEWLIMGHTSNIPGLMTRQFGWDNRTDLLVPLFDIWGWAINLKTLLASIFFLLLVLCAFAAARHLRAKDPRFLVAMVTPWLAMFTVLGQIHERYLLFAAGIGICLIAVSWGMLGLQLILSFFAFIQPLHVMLLFGLRQWETASEGYDGFITRDLAQQWLGLIAPTHPSIAWAIALCLLVYLYVALSPPRRRPRCKPDPEHDNAQDIY